MKIKTTTQYVVNMLLWGIWLQVLTSCAFIKIEQSFEYISPSFKPFEKKETSIKFVFGKLKHDSERLIPEITTIFPNSDSANSVLKFWLENTLQWNGYLANKSFDTLTDVEIFSTTNLDSNLFASAKQYFENCNTEKLILFNDYNFSFFTVDKIKTDYSSLTGASLYSVDVTYRTFELTYQVWDVASKKLELEDYYYLSSSNINSWPNFIRYAVKESMSSIWNKLANAKP